ncbi:cobyrinate a,c-diamide synthase [Lutibacter sp. HS1-25]|uniref:cobyrinate a,c-diamide synthase n=1 Tax=Lutibacter sp. HS1-25 TaxID=2485000 RepID=UPI0010129AE4|nr:cobyrinate a,c-diamide synthase [Lutibacter sp. HS1-25]RXP61404.1 cobyrinate a,c-diamide synthase [Lutibacter sp. HS1-25]
MTKKIPQFIIAAPTSNSGKTTVTLGLLRALENRGIATQPFKVGPDYIDPKFHKIACGKNGLNLDLYMTTTEDILTTYAKYAKNKGAVCVEGVMGLFDGARKSEGSTAELAKLLDLPIILVVDAKSVAYSVAPLLYGFKNFDKALNIAGVIFNKVNTKSHYQFLLEACEDVGIPALGYVPFIPDCEIPSRHLGLSIHEMQGYDSVIEKVANAMEETVAIDALLECCLLDQKKHEAFISTILSKKINIAVAEDEGFNFSYVQNIECLKQLGKITFFSPLNDKELPKVDLVYLPGGYPEFYTKQLSENKSMLQSIKNFAEAGGKIIAECGGMMYLGKSIIDKDGNEFEMASVFDFSTSMQAMKLNLGYRTIQFKNFELKGHEFHYSTIIQHKKSTSIATVLNARESEVDTMVFQYKNVIASYIHYYLGQELLLKKLLKLITN